MAIAGTVVALATIVIAIAVALMMFSDQGRGSKDADLTSRDIPTASERVRVLRRYVNSDLPLTDASFTVVIHDNEDGRLTVPGPSEWDIRAIATVPDGQFSGWIGDRMPVPHTGLPDWTRSIPGSVPEDATFSWYTDNGRPVDAIGTVVGVDPARGLVLLRVSAR